MDNNGKEAVSVSAALAMRQGLLGNMNLLEQEYFNSHVDLFTQDKHENYPHALYIVLAIHLKLDFLLSQSISYPLKTGAHQLGLEFDKGIVSDRISELEFKEKQDVAKLLGILSPKSVETITRINNIRNAFAHNMKIHEKTFDYFGE